VRSGLLNVKERPLSVRGPSSHLIATLAEPVEEEAALVERFVKPMSSSPSTGSLGRLHEDDRQILLGLLRTPLLASSGVHAPGPPDRGAVSRGQSAVAAAQRKQASSRAGASENLVANAPAHRSSSTEFRVKCSVPAGSLAHTAATISLP
jgi:hypothetical protein